ncbi:TonB-dependent receptor plug domain-containing protein, partial [Tannerella forsythia]|uniref:TonB-dependent receptor plug domain-containing protein n=1 Tax=Tannerella forsythia TaxID=28112 RepID=UPI0028EC32C7
MKIKKLFEARGLLTLLLCISTLSLSAQTITVRGTVTDRNNEPLTGATVVVEGSTSQGTVTDIDGNYTLAGVNSKASLEFSYVGMKVQKIAVNGRTTINVTLEEDSEVLGEVVVTALGIKRDKKALGYAIQEVKGDDIVSARENNIANALSGKISGLQVIKSSNGPGASSKIVIRGNNSVTNLNQPLIVVDGVPIDNFTGADNNDYWNPTADLGNGLGDINPEDIESMTVLKGGSAAALYGSRAGNG